MLELIITVALIGVLAAIAVPALSEYVEKVRVSRAIAEIRTLEKEIVAFKIDEGALPDSLDAIRQLDDPWGNPYRYFRIEGTDLKGNGSVRKDKSLVPLNSDYDLYSMGPDGNSKPPLTAQASHDDIIRANNGGFVGRASLY